ncbi:glutathione S-transferase N-terminal domain-containing protein [Undibacterium sp. 5I1]|uniref:glutathione S-transferase family protein n=1 Tax=unclassified Undibacterium TaxID=2630295 RepID=UPI002AB4CBAF|nr:MULTISPECIES: glutathione S-transferase N-terminal domain-containing protein [unclassified Undibacterium]MDY7539602.1 glutathione S-transferase N-terminal domain-containing protein [Undibacterium sp. 5I1]MEB0230447.1 glutathione S-transferase N-terminal domain-containing protein [Undibacterium sp. 10I3]MEB0258491.1 glutathione S-transferase N-terminal domain-containing protein [Undibacterium sp. 5I1]
MITLYTWLTPNGRKVSILLEELGISYRVQPVNLSKNEQFSPAFLMISPNNKIPALVDETEEGSISVFESGAILTYLAEKYGRFLPAFGAARYKTLEWLYWQVGGLGPMLGQVGFFEKFSKTKSPIASARFIAEADRLLTVMDKRLAEFPFLAGEEYSIADISAYPWVVTATTFLGDVLGDRMSSKPALKCWMTTIGERPAVQRGMAVPAI